MLLSKTLEKNTCHIFPNQQQGSKYIADQIKNLIEKKQQAGQQCVIGFATGNSVKALYEELIRLHQDEKLSFHNVIAFNLDEYYPIQKSNPNSYHQFMKEKLFKYININPKNIFSLNGEVNESNILEEIHHYEKKIDESGGIDIQILGIGINGHIGFNEPGSNFLSQTRLIHLHNTTRLANVKDFNNLSSTPRLALTMGISTILKAKKIYLMAWGENKAFAIKQALEGGTSELMPASALQNHNNCEYIIDDNAASELSRIKTPWLTGQCTWTNELVKKAVIHLALKLKKTILSLVNTDYLENGLGELLLTFGDAYKINLQVYYSLRDSITGWPGGKKDPLPNHPERQNPFPKKVIIFSPHPDDDIISMGGTFIRLNEQGHDVHVAYQTSGNIAVTDEFVTRFLDFAVGFEKMFNIKSDLSIEILNNARKFLADKKHPHDKDTQDIRKIKGLIRVCEAKATCRYVGIKENNIHFQNLPFYETGTIEKNPISEEDITSTINLLNTIQPHQIFCAGDLADPHGTHKICIEIIIEAITRIKKSNQKWLNDCYMWMYKGAWQEWNIEEIEMAVPMSPEQVKQKRFGIFIHQSQKDIVPFQGSDAREFWQRAEDRNAHTANLYGSLGLTQYAAIEAFKRYHF